MLGANEWWQERGAELLCSLSYAHARLVVDRRSGLLDVLQQCLAYLAGMRANSAKIPELESHLRFVRLEQHLFVKSDPSLVFPLALSYPNDALVSRKAAARQADWSSKIDQWVEWLNKPHRLPALLQTLPGHSEVGEYAG